MSGTNHPFTKSGGSSPREGRTDHGRPLFLVKYKSGRVFYIYCDICWAAKAGHFRRGKPRFSGGKILVRGTHEDGRPMRAIAACTCEHGDRFSRIHGGVKQFNRFKPEQCEFPKDRFADVLDCVVPIGAGSDPAVLPQVEEDDPQGDLLL